MPCTARAHTARGVDDDAFNDAFNDASTHHDRTTERYWLRKHADRRASDASSNASVTTAGGIARDGGVCTPSGGRAAASVSPGTSFAFAFATPSSRRATPGDGRGRGVATPATPMAFRSPFRSPTDEESARLELLLAAPLKPNGGRRARARALATPQQTPLKLRFENFASSVEEGRSEKKRARKMSDVFKATKSTSTPRVTRARKNVVQSL